MIRFQQDDHDRLIFYDNAVGYVSGETAVVDRNFESQELEGFLRQFHLTPQYREGVYDKLSEGFDPREEQPPDKHCRIWQLKNDSDVCMRFISYEKLTGKFGEPDPANYEAVYDGQLGTSDLEAIYTICNTAHPEGYRGHSLSVSDVVELYDENGSEFYYCDSIGFQAIDFKRHEQVQTTQEEMTM